MADRLILASTSPYRRSLLERLGVAFEVAAPGVDEQPQAGESPRALVARLARAKAEAVAKQTPGCWVLGSDQVAILEGSVLGKPGTVERCIAQLRTSSGREVTFLTAACLLNAADARVLEHVDETRVGFRALSDDEIIRYVQIERPFDCAGGFKCEGLGIALFTSIDNRDPTALIGLPLIWVAAALRQVGMPIP